MATPLNGVNFELVLVSINAAHLHTKRAPIAKPQWSYFPLKIKTLGTLIPPWRMTCNLKSFGASEEEVQDFGPRSSLFTGPVVPVLPSASYIVAGLMAGQG